MKDFARPNILNRQIVADRNPYSEPSPLPTDWWNVAAGVLMVLVEVSFVVLIWRLL